MTSAERGMAETGAPGACRFPLTVIPRCWRFARTQRAEGFAQSTPDRHPTFDLHFFD